MVSNGEMNSLTSTPLTTQSQPLPQLDGRRRQVVNSRPTISSREVNKTDDSQKQSTLLMDDAPPITCLLCFRLVNQFRKINGLAVEKVLI
jgi:hypothetical protein